MTELEELRIDLKQPPKELLQLTKLKKLYLHSSVDLNPEQVAPFAAQGIQVYPLYKYSDTDDN